MLKSALQQIQWCLRSNGYIENALSTIIAPHWNWISRRDLTPRAWNACPTNVTRESTQQTKDYGVTRAQKQISNCAGYLIHLLNRVIERFWPFASTVATSVTFALRSFMVRFDHVSFVLIDINELDFRSDITDVYLFCASSSSRRGNVFHAVVELKNPRTAWVNDFFSVCSLFSASLVKLSVFFR